MNINFAYKALQKLVIFRYGGFEVTVSDKWLHKTKEKEECKKTSSDQSTAVQEMACPHQQKLHTWCVAFGESVLQSLTRTTWADVNKIKVSECHSLPVLQPVPEACTPAGHRLFFTWEVCVCLLAVEALYTHWKQTVFYLVCVCVCLSAPEAPYTHWKHTVFYLVCVCVLSAPEAPYTHWKQTVFDLVCVFVLRRPPTPTGNRLSFDLVCVCQLRRPHTPTGNWLFFTWCVCLSAPEASYTHWKLTLWPGVCVCVCQLRRPPTPTGSRLFFTWGSMTSPSRKGKSWMESSPWNPTSQMW